MLLIYIVLPYEIRTCKCKTKRKINFIQAIGLSQISFIQAIDFATLQPD